MARLYRLRGRTMFRTIQPTGTRAGHLPFFPPMEATTPRRTFSTLRTLWGPWAWRTSLFSRPKRRRMPGLVCFGVSTPSTTRTLISTEISCTLRRPTRSCPTLRFSRRDGFRLRVRPQRHLLDFMQILFKITSCLERPSFSTLVFRWRTSPSL